MKGQQSNIHAQFTKYENRKILTWGEIEVFCLPSFTPVWMVVLLIEQIKRPASFCRG